jgi:hypothetical protein
MSAYITAQSWNGEWFYYNVIQDTWNGQPPRHQELRTTRTTTT